MTTGPDLRRRYYDLFQFLGGYLNQDCIYIYGSIEQAIDKFLSDATPSDRATTARQLGELLERCTDDGVLFKNLDNLGLEVDGSVGREITERAWVEELATKLGYVRPPQPRRS